MGLVIDNSPDISFLSVRAVFDISQTIPTVLITNQSQGPNLTAVSYAYIIKSPTQTFIHDGSLSMPDISGIWSQTLVSDPWPRPFNRIEFSGSPYSFQILAKDSDGNEYEAPIQYATICPPNGNIPTSKNTFGKGDVLVQVKCEQSRIFFQDITNTSYRGLTGEIGSSVLRVNFPMDETGVVPAPFVGGNFSAAMVPITYSGKGYQFLYTSIYEYELAEDTFVRIKYLLSNTFGVFCNIDLMPLLCEYQKLITSIETGSCNDVAEANRKLMLINPKFSLVVMGILQPLTGIDVPTLIREIEEIGGFLCDCCNAATGITPPGSSAFDGYTFSVVPLGGDINGQVVANGFNIQIELTDVSYIFKVCDTSPTETTAFTVVPTVSLDGYTKTYCLQVDVTQLAEDILTTISNNIALINLFNSIVQGQAGNFTLIVDGDCIFSSSATCDYELTLSNIPINTTFALLTSIKIGSTNTPLSFSFNLTNLPALQTYLNGLGLGTFAVTNPSGQTVLISSSANANDIQQLTYKISATNFIAGLSKNCTGFVPISANQVVQNIINYLCSLDDAEMVTSAEYQICYIDPVTKIKTISTVATGTALTKFITELLAKGCNTIDYIISLGAITCNGIKAQFPANNVVAMQPNDIFLVTKAGACSQITPNEAFLTLLTYGINNPDVFAAFCAFVSACSGGSPCAPYSIFFVETEAGSPADSYNLTVTFTHPAAISNTIRYARIDNTVTPVYITIPGVLPGQSPYEILGVPAGQYRVGITPIYADGRTCSETFYNTPACTGINSFSANYDGTNINITYSASVSLPFVKVNISYPNGGSFTQVYANGAPIVITPPPFVYGTFFATLQPVCDEVTGFFGVATSPAAFVINPPNNSYILNNTAVTSFNIGVLFGSNQVVATSSLAPSAQINFYIADGTYSPVEVQGITTADFTVALSTGTGTYYGVFDGVSKYVFGSVPILSGCTISISDDASPGIGQFLVNNNSTLATVDSLTPSGIYSIVSGSFPLAPSNAITATHTGFATLINIVISGGGITPGTNVNVQMTKNGILQQCITFNAAGNNNFTSIPFTSSDICAFLISDGGCSI